jgi:hypothetical protein
LLGDEIGGEPEPSRLGMLHNYQDNLLPVLEDYLNRLLFTSSRPELKPAWIAQWARSLPHSEPAQGRSQGTEASNLLAQFLADFFNDRNLIENIQSGNYEEASNYDVARLFCFVIDRAISRLPWEVYSSFISKSLSTLSRDLSIAASPGAQHLLFEAKRSLFSPFATDMIFETIKGSMYGQNLWSEADEVKRALDFSRKNNRLFFDKIAAGKGGH